MFHEFLDTERFALLPPAENVIEYHPRYEDRSEQVRRETNCQGDGESPDWTRSEAEQNQGRDDGGHVGVDDGQEGVVKPPGHRRAHWFPHAQFLADALKDEHVG